MGDGAFEGRPISTEEEGSVGLWRAINTAILLAFFAGPSIGVHLVYRLVSAVEGPGVKTQRK